MRKLFVVLLILMIIACTACSNDPAASDPTMWRINENAIDREFKYMPKAFYNADGSIKTNFEVGLSVYQIEKDTIVSSKNYDYEVVDLKTTKYLQADDISKFYFVEPDLYERYRNGEWIDQIKLWRVFLDKDGKARCHEYILKRGKQYLTVHKPHANSSRVNLYVSIQWEWNPHVAHNPREIIIFFSVWSLE